MKTWKRASLFSLMAALLLAQGGCDLIEPKEQATGGGTSIDGLTGDLVVMGGSPAAGATVRVYSAGGSTGLSKSAEASEALALDSVQANSAGRFQFKNLPDGTYNLSASLRLSDTILSLWLPEIAVAGKTSLGVDTLHVSGTIVLQVRAGNAAVSGALCAVAGGAWQASSDSLGVCTITGVPPGTFQATITHPSYSTALSADITVVGGATASGGVITLVGVTVSVPAAPVLTVPAAASLTVFPVLNLRWDTVPGATGYHVQVSSTSAFTPLAVNDSTVSATEHTVSLTSGITYYWRVRARNSAGYGAFSVTWTFTTGTPPITPPVPPIPTGDTLTAPTPAYPLSGALNVPATPTFTWSSVSGATLYHLEVIGSDFASIKFVNDSTLTGNSRAVGPLQYLVGYSWRVRARNGSGWGPWSATITFMRDEMPMGPGDTTSQPALGTPALTAPAASATGVSVNPTLSWNAVSGATSYNVAVSTDTGFLFYIHASAVSGTSLALPASLSPGVTYYWRVQANSSTGASHYSGTRSFTTNPTGQTAGWTVVSGTGGAFSAVTASKPDTLLFAVGSGGMIWTSTNGTSWTSRQTTTTNGLNSVAWGPVVVIVGNTGTIYTATVQAPTTLTGRTSGTSRDLHGVTWDSVQSQFVAVGLGGTILTSQTGSTWTQRVSGTTANLRAVTRNGSILVAVGDAGIILTSPDGATWTTRTSGTTKNFYAVTGRAGSSFVASGEDGLIRTSADGIAWTDVNIGLHAVIYSLAYNGTTLTAVGVDGLVLTSTNAGANWAIEKLSTSSGLRGVTAYKTGWIAVGTVATSAKK
jgi:hypothetical protein